VFTQNSKLAKSGIYGFGLCPGQTCVKCSIKCYAVRGMYNTFSRTMTAMWDKNLERTKSRKFTTEVSTYLWKHSKIKYVRIHPEGDFYSQEYLNKWIRVARLCPDVQFYAYTKALHLSFAECPSNMKIVQSIGGEHDDKIDYSKPHARIFGTLHELVSAGYENCSDDDLLAANPETIKIGLVEH